MTIVWFVIWLIANNVGGGESLEASPVNAWLATLILAVALDLNRPDALTPGASGPRRGPESP
jgi:hypothetical protein